MEEFHVEVIRRYRRIAHLPDLLFAFTIPLRRRAVDYMQIRKGSRGAQQK